MGVGEGHHWGATRLGPGPRSDSQRQGQPCPCPNSFSTFHFSSFLNAPLIKFPARNTFSHAAPPTQQDLNKHLGSVSQALPVRT